jgi:hypothetical protein
MLVGENPEMDPPGQLSQMSPTRISLHHESMPPTNRIPASTVWIETQTTAKYAFKDLRFQSNVYMPYIIYMCIHPTLLQEVKWFS